MEGGKEGDKKKINQEKKNLAQDKSARGDLIRMSRIKSSVCH